MALTYLSKARINKFIKSALTEDVGDGDHTSLGSIPESDKSRARLLIKDSGVIAGIELAEMIFHHVDPSMKVEVKKKDGDWVESGDIALVVSGNTRNILKSERLVLNCMQRMSGIATYTFKLNKLIEGTSAKLLDTRKTTPNFRMMEKWAVSIGGGVNHRFGLYDLVLLKDNHVDYAGGIKKAVNASVQYLKEKELDLDIEIEVRNMIELEEALELPRVKRILLDNMLPSEMRLAVQKVNKTKETEASGGINEKNIREIAETGVDYISVGALTHSYRSLDMSLKADKE
ncbi:MAG: carboxylating nicotinate-nucleotide diphosphorylase [Cyclobacteriaceae bacterium]